MDKQCNPTEHKFIHVLVNYGPYNRFVRVIIYCEKCGQIALREEED